MIFIIHYLLFNAGLSAILILLTLFLQTYTSASLTEIGALLMILPFVTIIVKPLFCAMADRHQAHKRYLIISLLIMAAGYGTLAIAPFFPDFYQQHGRLVWYLDAVGIILGFCAFGVAWSLGDALSVNAARVKGVPWGSIRVWATISWGGFGVIIGQINETPLLPKYVPAFFVLVGTLLLEAFLLLIWSDKPFDMSAPSKGEEEMLQQLPPVHHHHHQQPSDLEMNEAHWPNAASLSGTLNGSARLNPRLMGAMANFLMEDVGGSIKSSLRGRGQAQKRTALADILEQNQLKQVQPMAPLGQPAPAAPPSQQSSPSLAQKWQHSPIQLNKSLAADSCSITGSAMGGQVSSSGTLGRAALRRTQRIFSPMNSLSSSSGHAIADQLRAESGAAGDSQDSPQQLHKPGKQRAQVMTMSSLASGASLGGVAAARAAMGLQQQQQSQTGSPASLKTDPQLASGGSGELCDANDSFASANLAGGQGGQLNGSIGGGGGGGSAAFAADQAKSMEQLQMILLKLIVKRDRQVLKSLILFTMFGVLFTIHNSYFFLNVEEVCRTKGYDFSSVTGAMVASQSVTEIICFLVVVPYVLPLIGRSGALLLPAILFGTRYAFYGTFYADLNPYAAVATETMQGVAYAIIYTLITDIATECVDKVDDYVPELVQRRIIHPQMDPNQLKLPLRATMQGVYSGAFDGLGNGIGALLAGIYLEHFSYMSLWRFCGGISAVTAVLYVLSEWRTFFGAGRKSVERATGAQAVKQQH